MFGLVEKKLLAIKVYILLKVAQIKACLWRVASHFELGKIVFLNKFC